MAKKPALARTRPASQSAALDHAVALFSAGRLAETLVFAELALTQAPNFAPLLNVVGAAAAMLGDRASAERHWRRAIDAQPHYAEAHYNLGLLLVEAQRLDEAEAALRTVVGIRPDHADAHDHLGVLLQQTKRGEAAEVAYRRALAIRPTFAAAHFHLGNLLLQSGRLEEAESAYRKTLTIDPNHADAHNHLGILLQRAKQYENAEAAFRQALAIRPTHAETCNNLGLLLQETGRFADAQAAYRHALAIRPDLAEAHYNLGILLHGEKRCEAAEAAYRQALAIRPQHAEAHNNLGILLRETKRYEAAETAFRQSLALRPDHPETHNNLGSLLQQTKRLEEAETAYQQALALRPDYAQAHSNLGVLLKETKRLEAAEAAHRRALACNAEHGDAAGNAYHLAGELCDWRRRSEDEARLVEMVRRGSGVAPFALLNLDTDEAAALQRRNSHQHAQDRYGAYLRRSVVDSGLHPARDRLRIGYLSADFHEHATMYLLQGVLGAHDRSRFAVHGYSYGPKDDSLTERARKHCDIFRDLAGLSDSAAANQIAADGIDILVDLKGFTANTRLEISALRPAPVLVSWLGYPGTLGHPRLADYLIGDPIVTPPEHAGHFSETLALLPHCYQPNDNRRPIGSRPSRTQAGLPESGIIFCSFNQAVKYNPQSLDLWCRLLGEVPDSVLWLLAPSAPAIGHLQQQARERGIDSDRLVFAPARPLTEHLGRLQLADIALDTFPCTSHTTGSDCLWAGVPLVSRMGQTFASRVSSSLLHAVGLPELVTHTPERYLAQAKALAQDPTQLAVIRQKLLDARRTAALFDTNRFTRDLEQVFERIWQQHAQGTREIILPEAARATASSDFCPGNTPPPACRQLPATNSPQNAHIFP